MKHEDKKAEWLNAYQGFKKYLHQCVVCQVIGYDPEKILSKEGRFFQERVKEFFPPMTVNEIGICSGCAEHLAKDRKT